MSNTAWDDSNSFGSSYSNILGGNDNYEISNIFCRAGRPHTNVCKRFYQITEKDIINSLFHRQKEVGREISPEPQETGSIQDSSAFLFGRRHRWRILYWIRNMIWGGRRWHSSALDDFIDKVNPDIIFQPVYYSTYIGEIALYVQKRKNIPMVGYISDDCYTLKQFSLSPSFWIDRLVTRRYVKKVIEACSILYTITPRQRDEYNEIFGDKCKVLSKGCVFDSHFIPKETLNSPLRLLYAGNLGGGRWKTLSMLVKQIAQINKDDIKAQLTIYSQTPLSSRILRQLNIENVSRFLGAISSEEVTKRIQDSDILVHVESFSIKDRYSSRLSFSTKITDYLQAGKCILAIGWEQSGAIEMLEENNAACVITDTKDISSKVSQLIDNPMRIIAFGREGYKYGGEQFEITKIRNMVYCDLTTVITRWGVNS